MPGLLGRDDSLILLLESTGHGGADFWGKTKNDRLRQYALAFRFEHMLYESTRASNPRQSND